MEELIIKSQKGDKQAFTELIYEIRHDLYKIARCRLTNEDDIEDAVQETMIIAFHSIKKLKKINSFKSWITKILINRCNHIYKKNKNRNISFENETIENTYRTNEKYENLDNLDFFLILKDLTYNERIAITLFYLEDYSILEISKILKTNPNTIKTRLKRGKEKIRNNYMKGETKHEHGR